jgi:hypothetical protein
LAADERAVNPSGVAPKALSWAPPRPEDLLAPPTITATALQAPPGWLELRDLGVNMVAATETHLTLASRSIAIADVIELSLPGYRLQGTSSAATLAVHNGQGGAERLTIPLGADRGEADMVLDLLWLHVVPKLVADSIEHVACGLTLTFGELRVDRTGFGTDAHMAPWSSFAGVIALSDRFKARHRNHNGTSVVANAGFGEANGLVAFALLPYLASQQAPIRPLSTFGRRMLDIGERPAITMPEPATVPHDEGELAPVRRVSHRATGVNKTFSQRFTIRLIARLTLVAAIAIGGAVKFIVTARDAKPVARPTPITGGAKLKGWDSKVADVAAFIEKARGEAFKHPVTVSFLDDTAFTSRQARAHATPRGNPETTAALARARGYATSPSGHVDSGPVLYLATTDEVIVRGNRLDLASKVALAHELMRAWQHQHFATAPNAATPTTDTSAFMTERLLAGDARRVADLYMASQSSTERNESTIDEDRALDDAAAMFTTYLASIGALDGEIQTPFLEERDLLVPELHTAAPTTPKPALAATETPIAPNEFAKGSLDDGALSLYRTLSARLEPVVAWRAATVPALGMASVPFRRESRVCVRSSIVVVDSTNRALVNVALTKWVAAGPLGMATIEPSGAQLILTTCDPGAASAPAPTRALQTLSRFAHTQRAASDLLVNANPGADRRCALEKIRATFDATSIGTNAFADGRVPAAVTAATQAADAAC